MGRRTGKEAEAEKGANAVIHILRLHQLTYTPLAPHGK